MILNKFSKILLRKVRFEILSNRNELFFCIFSIAFIAFLFIALYVEVLNINVWRHDELIFLNSYYGKLISEGRWINYILFPYLKFLSPHIAIFVNYICLFYFSYSCTKKYSDNILFALLLAMTTLEIPALYSIIGWPVTVMPSFVVLAFLTWLSGYCTQPILYLIGGVLFFGGFNNFYNLLPLLYLSSLCKQGAKELFQNICFWVCFYLFGYLIMLISVKILGGHFGLTIQSWRNPTPATDLVSLLQNIDKVVLDIKNHVRIVGHKFLLIFTLPLVAILIKKRLNAISKVCLVLLLVIFSCYAQMIPLGLHVDARTAIPFFIGVLSFSLIWLTFSKPVAILFLIVLGLNWNVMNTESIRYYTTITNTYRLHLEATGLDFKLFNKIHLCMSSKDLNQLERELVKNAQLNAHYNERIDAKYRFLPIIKSFGSTGNIDTNESRCSALLSDDCLSNQLYKYKTINNELFLWLNR